MTYHRQCYPCRPNPARHLQPCVLRVLDAVARVDLIECKRNDEEAKHRVNIVLHGTPPTFVVLLHMSAREGKLDEVNESAEGDLQKVEHAERDTDRLMKIRQHMHPAMTPI
jgi:hypothetical protein